MLTPCSYKIKSSMAYSPFVIWSLLSSLISLSYSKPNLRHQGQRQTDSSSSNRPCPSHRCFCWEGPVALLFAQLTPDQLHSRLRYYLPWAAFSSCFPLLCPRHLIHLFSRLTPIRSSFSFHFLGECVFGNSHSSLYPRLRPGKRSSINMC